jgi:hypothetical protein
MPIEGITINKLAVVKPQQDFLKDLQPVVKFTLIENVLYVHES